jgi:hypothetical protein
MRTLLFAPLLAACVPSEPDAIVEVAPATCDVTVGYTVPAPGATDAFYAAPVEFHLSAPDPSAIVISDVAGVQTTSDDGLVVTFTPTPALQPMTDYSFGLDYCHGEPTIGFRTSDYGAAVADPAALVGRTFAIDLTTARFAAGDRVGDVARGFFDRDLLVHVIDSGDGFLVATIGIADATGTMQDDCARTVQLALGFENPAFAVDLDELDFEAYAAGLAVYDLQVTGTIAPDGTALDGVAIATLVDVRDLAVALDIDGAQPLCELASSLGAECEACPTDGAVACVRLEADGIAGDAVDIDVGAIDAACEQP